MIYAFDLDGTIVEAWYGKTTPLWYTDDKDIALRSSIVDCYEFVHPLPYINPFLQEAKDIDETATFAILSRICNGAEFAQKLRYIAKTFVDKNRVPFFKENNIYGPTSDDDKIHILESLAVSEPVVYFDDTLSFLHKLNKAQYNKKKTDNHILGVHASSLAVKKPSDIINAYAAYNESFL